LSKTKRTVYLELWREREAVEEDPAECRPGCTDLALMQSNLQKAVRRGLGRSAQQTALEMAHCKGGFASLCRRMPIIALEDVGTADRDLVTCVWLMLAVSTKGCDYRPRPRDFEFVQRYALALARHGVHEENDGVDEGERCSKRRKTSVSGCVWSSADARGDHVAMALLVRAAYGGMRCDVEMLEEEGAKDQSSAPELITSNAFLNQKVQSTRLTRENMLPAAVDFHVDATMARKLHSSLPRAKQGNWTEDDIKAAIWAKSSSVNVRKAAGDGSMERLEGLWWSIQAELCSLQNQRIRRAFPCR